MIINEETTKLITQRAASETDVYIELISSLVMSMFSGYARDSKDTFESDLKAALNRAMATADILTDIGTRVFEERAEFWRKEFEKVPDPPSATLEASKGED